MSHLLLSMLAAFPLILAMSALLWWRQTRLAAERQGTSDRPCGCASACSEHLYQIAEPAPRHPPRQASRL